MKHRYKECYFKIKTSLCIYDSYYLYLDSLWISITLFYYLCWAVVLLFLIHAEIADVQQQCVGWSGLSEDCVVTRQALGAKYHRPQVPYLCWKAFYFEAKWHDQARWNDAVPLAQG